MNEKIIQLNYGGRYQIIDGAVYSLNYGEKGMCGSTMGKRLPSEIAERILSTYEYEEEFRNRIGRRSISSRQERIEPLKMRDEERKVIVKPKRATRTQRTGVKLLLKKER